VSSTGIPRANPCVGVKAMAAYARCIKLRHHFDDNLPVRSGAQHGKDRRQAAVKAHIDDTAAHRNHRAVIGRRCYAPHLIVHTGLIPDA
jgi:hypothetical protein